MQNRKEKIRERKKNEPLKTFKGHIYIEEESVMKSANNISGTLNESNEKSALNFDLMWRTKSSAMMTSKWIKLPIGLVFFHCLLFASRFSFA